MRLLFAVFASTLSVAIVSGMVLWISVLHSQSSEGVSIGIAIVLAYTVGAAIGTALVGLPVHIAVSDSSKKGSLLPYLLTGLIVPFAATLVIRPFGDGGAMHLFDQSLVSSVLGAICSLVFWLVAARHRTTIRKLLHSGESRRSNGNQYANLCQSSTSLARNLKMKFSPIHPNLKRLVFATNISIPVLWILSTLQETVESFVFNFKFRPIATTLLYAITLLPIAFYYVHFFKHIDTANTLKMTLKLMACIVTVVATFLLSTIIFLVVR